MKSVKAKKPKFLGWMQVYDYEGKLKIKPKLNDQKPKPLLGNGKLHGISQADNAGGANPPPVNPGKAKRK